MNQACYWEIMREHPFCRPLALRQMPIKGLSSCNIGRQCLEKHLDFHGEGEIEQNDVEVLACVRVIQVSTLSPSKTNTWQIC